LVEPGCQFFFGGNGKLSGFAGYPGRPVSLAAKEKILEKFKSIV